MQAAGLADQQLQNQNAKDEAMLQNLLNPPEAPGGPKAPGNTPLEKMLLASLARRMVRKAGPKFGAHSHSHGKGRTRKRKTPARKAPAKMSEPDGE